MAAKRDTYRYRFNSPSGKILRSGITNDPERREREHKATLSKNGSLEKVGPPVSRETALKWEGRKPTADKRRRD